MPTPTRKRSLAELRDAMDLLQAAWERAVRARNPDVQDLLRLRDQVAARYGAVENLTGIYDRLLDRAARKELGEFYTPPSIARYMIRRVGLKKGDYVLDPACGNGIFLVEAYKELVGDAVERGAAGWPEVSEALSRICGSDLNSSSAAMAQIHLLWHVSRFNEDIEAHGLACLPITGNVNALTIRGSPRYAAVIGNPPYVRVERNGQSLDAVTAGEFEGGTEAFPGISAKLNSYALFLYRALHSWARPPGANGEPAGRVAFIVQVSLFDSTETADLRRLLAPGGRWTLREIVDLELIYREIFDADVLPAIVICENRPPTPDDLVSIRIATRDCIKPHEGHAIPTFDLDSLPESKIPYPDVFTPDGRILTRLTAERASILGKLWQLETLGHIAKRYWVRRKPPRTAVDTEPTEDLPLYEERRMICGGIAFRGEKARKPGGLEVYKAENIIAGEVQGAPVLTDCDLAAIDDPSLWRFPGVLSQRAFAIAQVAHCPNAAAFNPRQAAFTNTATLFVPASPYEAFPFDLLFLSRPYVYFYALAARMGVLRLCRSHIYPTNLAQLPWSPALLDVAGDIEALRQEIVAAHCAFSAARTAVLDRLDALVGGALGLTPEDIGKVQHDCATDPFLRRIQPRYPGTRTRKQGFRSGLDSSKRYE